MKYYGLATKRIDGKKTAFFLDGEDIILATEGMTVKKRYKIVRINAESVVHRRHGRQARADLEDLGGRRWHGSRRRKNERGFALLLVFLMAAIVAHHPVYGTSARCHAGAAR